MDTGTTLFNLNLRSGPGLDQPVLTILTAGTQLAILGTSGEWLQVRAPDSAVGFVSAQFVEIQRATSIAPPPPVIPSARRVTPSGTFLNIRSTPMIAPDNLIGRVDAGVVLTPLEDEAAVLLKVGTVQDQNLWLRIRTPEGLEGFVAAWLLQLEREPEPEQPDAPDDPPPDTTRPTDTSVPVPALASLYQYISTIPDGDYPLPQGYRDFWAQRERLGLPAPFDVSPTQPSTYDLKTLMINGFGPNTFAFRNWTRYYKFVCGMHNGLDHIVPAGTPLLAVSDGIIVGTEKQWQFLSSRYEKTLVLWCFLPEHIRDAQGRRMLSNVLVAYGHMSDNSIVGRREVVKAGQVIGFSGFPVNVGADGNPSPETGNAHLHLEVHLLSGDNQLPRPIRRVPGLLGDYKRPQPFDTNTPFNPLLFFSERLVKYHRHQGKKIGYAGGPTYPSPETLAGLGIQWQPLDFFSVSHFQYGRNASIWDMKTLPWQNGVYDLGALLQRVNQYTPFEPYPFDFT